MIRKHTKDLIEKLVNKKKIIVCKRIYKVKEGTPGVKPQRYKVRLVAKDFTQREDINFTKVFSPVVGHSSLRILLSLATVKDMHFKHMDVKTVFLNGDLNKMIVLS